MKLPFFLNPLFLVIALLIFSCTKTETNYYPETAKTLVIITDNDQSSDIMVGILGAVRTSYPSVNIEFYPSKAFNVFEGSYLLYITMQAYPKGSVIAGIVEPGAASKRIVYQADGKLLIAPDNMLSTRILHAFPSASCYFVENPQVLGGAQPGSLSFEEFYKRAILSLMAGTSLNTFGPVCSIPAQFPVQEPVISGDTIKGEVLFTDNFGNCTTNIPLVMVSGIPQGTVLNLASDTTHLAIVMGTSYSSVPVGSNVCFVNSSQRLELAVNYGNFSGKYSIGASSKIRLVK
ncbi:MAG: SAM-dependent chlorinase/fluorinase [Bacteroidota bacterium]